MFASPEVFDGRVLAMAHYRIDVEGLRAELQWLDLTGFRRERHRVLRTDEAELTGLRDGVRLEPAPRNWWKWP